MTTECGWSHNPPPTATGFRAPPTVRACGAVSTGLRTARGCGPAWTFALLTLLSVRLARADGPAGLQGPSAAPNQSLAVDVVPDEGAPSVAPETLPRVADRAAAASVPHRRLSTGTAGSRRSLVDVLRADSGALPWYRTGIGATGIVVSTILLLFLGARRWLPKVAPSDASTLRVAARVTLTPRHSLALVQIGRRFVLLGLSPDHVAGVCDIRDEEEVAELKAHFGAGRTAFRRFEDLMADERDTYSPPRVDADRARGHIAGAIAPAERSEEIGQLGSDPGFRRPAPAREPWRALSDLRNRIRSLRGKDRPAVARS